VGNGVTIYGQEMDNATAALAKMNMILHDNPTAEIWKDNVLASPHFKQADGSLKPLTSLSPIRRSRSKLGAMGSTQLRNRKPMKTEICFRGSTHRCAGQVSCGSFYDSFERAAVTSCNSS